MTSLEEKARHIRQLILTALAEAGSGHTGGSLDLVDIFTVLYFDHLRHDPQHPDWEGRDKVVLSIGHTAPVLYATLAAAGYFPEDSVLDTSATTRFVVSGSSPLSTHSTEA